MTATATAISTVRKPKLSERVVSALRRQVLGGEIVPGQKLPTESQLTETFGVSRTVIREAIAALAAEGVRAIRVVPLFLGAGGHVKDDLPPLVSAARAAHPGLAITLEDPIGERPEVIVAIADALRR